MTKEIRFANFKSDTLPELSELIKHLIANLDTPELDLTISTSDTLEDFRFQPGDNSFTGSCYFDPHWAVTTLTKESDPNGEAEYLIEQLGDLIFS